MELHKARREREGKSAGALWTGEAAGSELPILAMALFLPLLQRQLNLILLYWSRILLLLLLLLVDPP